MTGMSVDPNTGRPLWWVGGRLVCPFYSVTEGKAYRPELFVWIECPAGTPVYSRFFGPDGPTLSFAESLLEATRSPLSGSPRRPRAIRVAPELAGEVKQVLPEVEVVACATRELDVLLRAVARLHSENAGAKRSYLEQGRVLPASVENLFLAASMLRRVSPWLNTDEELLARVDIPALGVDGACLVVPGDFKVHDEGFLLLAELEDHQHFVDAMEALWEDDDWGAFGTAVLSLNYEDEDDMPPGMLAEVLWHRWRIPHPSAYPVVEYRDSDGVERPLFDHDIQVAAACAGALANFFLEYGVVWTDLRGRRICQTYSISGGPEVRLTVPHEKWTPVEWIGSGAEESGSALHDPEDERATSKQTPPSTPKVGRNQPCPCGSGKKYKKCCLGSLPRLGSGPFAQSRSGQALTARIPSSWIRGER